MESESNPGSFNIQFYDHKEGSWASGKTVYLGTKYWVGAWVQSKDTRFTLKEVDGQSYRLNSSQHTSGDTYLYVWTTSGSDTGDKYRVAENGSSSQWTTWQFLTKAGTVLVDVVSLFPPTFKGRENGCREDLAQILADCRPTFLRFPGGCVVEGNGTIDNQQRFEWKKTIGPIEQRPGHFNNNWGYDLTDGLGFLEYLELCEDLGFSTVHDVAKIKPRKFPAVEIRCKYMGNFRSNQKCLPKC